MSLTTWMKLLAAKRVHRAFWIAVAVVEIGFVSAFVHFEEYGAALFSALICTLALMAIGLAVPVKPPTHKEMN